MHNKPLFFRAFFILLMTASFFVGCSSKEPSSENHTSEKRTTLHEFLVPEASEEKTYGNKIVSIDASNVTEGYVMIKYDGA